MGALGLQPNESSQNPFSLVFNILENTKHFFGNSD